MLSIDKSIKGLVLCKSIFCVCPCIASQQTQLHTIRYINSCQYTVCPPSPASRLTSISSIEHSSGQSIWVIFVWVLFWNLILLIFRNLNIYWLISIQFFVNLKCCYLNKNRGCCLWISNILIFVDLNSFNQNKKEKNWVRVFCLEKKMNNQ